MNTQLLIVDDENEIQELLRRHFRYEGHDVQIAGNGAEALEQMGRARVDVVVSDIQMPVMDGVELLGRIRQEYPMTRVIMMTGYVSQSKILSCMRLGAETCVFKPLEDLAELDAAVAQAMQTIKRWWQILAELQGRKSLHPVPPDARGLSGRQ